MAIIVVFVLGIPRLATAEQDVEVVKKFSGKIADPELADARPDSGWLDNADDWTKLWRTWRPDEPIAEIDFENKIVLVETVPGPNLVFASILKLSDEGDLKYETAGARAPGPGFGYLVMVVPKSGIKTVNGLQRDASSKARPTTESPIGNQPTPPDPNPRPTASVQPASEPKMPEGKPGVDPKTADREFVNVEIVGRVRTQFQSVGADTTGTLVAADGIVWELDLRNDKKLREAARRLGDSLARISGQLRMERHRGSLDGRVRWIVQVHRFEPLSEIDSNPNAEIPTEVVVTHPKETQQLANDSQTHSFDPNTQSPDSEDVLPPSITSPESIPETPSSFRKLSIVTSDGQTQTIHSDGGVQYEAPARGISNTWVVEASTISKLHQFVADTEWDRVPKLTRSKLNDPDEIGYTISIETPRGVTRIYIDRTAVVDQPKIQQFFGIVSEMAQNQ